MSSQVRWIDDPKNGESFWFDLQGDCLVYKNGRREGRPKQIPRECLQNNETYRSFLNNSQNERSAMSPSWTAYTYGSTPGVPTRNVPRSIGSQLPLGTAASSDVSASMTRMALSDIQSPAPCTDSLRPIAGPSYDGRTTAGRTQGQPTMHTNSSQIYTPIGTGKRPLVSSQDTSPSQLHYSQQWQQGPPTPMPARVEPTMFQTSDGMQVSTLHDIQNGVMTRYATSPPESITDPVLLEQGIPASRKVISIQTRGWNESENVLDHGFKIQKHRFFRVGRVFHILWVEPAGANGTDVTDIASIVDTRFGEKAHAKTRRFVVIREADWYCSALPIATYGRQGVAKKDVNKSEHGIIYSGQRRPQPVAGEIPQPGERGMLLDAIRVDPDQQDEKLDPLSRIDYGKVHTIHHNIRVKSVGSVCVKDIDALLSQFSLVWARKPSARTSSGATDLTRRLPRIGLGAQNTTGQGSSSRFDGSRSQLADSTLPGSPSAAMSKRVEGGSDNNSEEERNLQSLSTSRGRGRGHVQRGRSRRPASRGRASSSRGQQGGNRGFSGRGS